MNDALTNLKSQWSALPARSRTLALAGAVVVGVALLYTAVWSPLQKDLQRLRANVPRETGELAWMRGQAPLAKSARARAVSSSGALAAAVEQSAAAHGVRPYITKIEPEGNAGARLTIDAIPFNTFVTWLADLQATQGAVVEDASIEAHATPGLVNARLRLRSGGA